MTLIKIHDRTESMNFLNKYQKNSLDIGGLKLNFQRTCRVPQGKINSLPAGLGEFPLFRVSDFRSGAPKHWNEESYFFPMYRQEAMWINFERWYSGNPKALVVAAGNINAISGKPFDLSKNMVDKKRKNHKEGELVVKLEKDQNYLVVPPQPWLDGWKSEDGKIYQFVAAELGSGETVEGQITGEESVGGIQLIVYDPKPGQKLIRETRPNEYMSGGSWEGFDMSVGDVHPFMEKGMFMSSMILSDSYSGIMCRSSTPRARSRSVSINSVSAVRDMGLGKGGEIEQKIYPDPYGIDVWNKDPRESERLHLVSSEDFKQITGHDAPKTPVTYEKYQELGLPWFELYDNKYKDTKGSGIFDKLKPVGEGKAQTKDGKIVKANKDWVAKFK